MRSILLVGSVGVGKTTLKQRLRGEDLSYAKTQALEVHDGVVDAYEGGYSAYVLARAERDRTAAVTEQKRLQLVKKELAWLRRGPPARTSKPQFRIDAANALIAGNEKRQHSVVSSAIASHG